jgi:RNA polymerase sigma-70 factor (ECF subfamily)
MLTAPSDEDLALRYRDGELAAFEELYRRHGHGVYGFIAWCAPQRDRVDAVVLDSWAVLHQARGRYLASASFRTFLYQIAHSRLAELMRHDPGALPAGAMAGPMRDDAPGAALPAQPDAAPLRRAIRALPDEQRELLMLQQFSGLGAEEIALLCAIPLDTVETRLREARHALRPHLDIGAGGADPDTPTRDALGTILRGLPPQTPPADLDLRIHAQARAALDHPARVAHDPVMSAPPADADAAADDEEAPRPSNPFGHLRVPMAVAAVLVIGITLALQLGDWRAPASPSPGTAGGQAAQTAPAHDEPDPAGAMARIAALLDQHRDAEAREAWQAFRRRHPDTPVPDAWRARVESLPPAR